MDIISVLEKSIRVNGKTVIVTQTPSLNQIDFQPIAFDLSQEDFTLDEQAKVLEGVNKCTEILHTQTPLPRYMDEVEQAFFGKPFQESTLIDMNRSFVNKIINYEHEIGMTLSEFLIVKLKEQVNQIDEDIV